MNSLLFEALLPNVTETVDGAAPKAHWDMIVSMTFPKPPLCPASFQLAPVLIYAGDYYSLLPKEEYNQLCALADKAALAYQARVKSCPTVVHLQQYIK